MYFFANRAFTQIYNNDITCFNLIILSNGFVVDTTQSGTRVGQIIQSIDSGTRSSIPNQTRVFDQSLIYLFKEFDMSLQKQFATCMKDTSTIPEDDLSKIVVDIAGGEEPRKKMLASTTPNLDALPNTVSTFSISSQTEDDPMQEEVGEECSERFDECSLLSIESEVWEPEETGEDFLPDSMLLREEHDDKEFEKTDMKHEMKTFEHRTSMSTIYSEESFEVIESLEENKLLDFDLYSSEIDDDAESEQTNLLNSRVETKSKPISGPSSKSPHVVDGKNVLCDITKL